jgi:hypothetical protein
MAAMIDMAAANDALEIAVMERKHVHGNVPIMNWSVSNPMDPCRQP